MKPTGEIKQITTDNPPTITSHLNLKSAFVPKWAAIIGILSVGIIYMFLPDSLVIGPSWLLLVIEAVFLLPIIISWLIGHRFSHNTIRLLSLTLLGIMTLALAIGIALLINNLPHNIHATNLLRSAALLWSFNILLFALWYWEIDGGGPIQRHFSGHLAADLMFPQQAEGKPGNWAPNFIDYLFVAFTGATALSPTDTYPLTRKAKALMMIEAMLSLVIIVLLAARAVNILGS